MNPNSTSTLYSDSDELADFKANYTGTFMDWKKLNSDSFLIFTQKIKLMTLIEVIFCTPSKLLPKSQRNVWNSGQPSNFKSSITSGWAENICHKSNLLF